MDPQTVDMLAFVYTNTRALRRDRAIKAIAEQTEERVASYAEQERAIQEAIIAVTEDDTLGLEEDMLIPVVLGKRKRQLEEDDDQEGLGMDLDDF